MLCAKLEKGDNHMFFFMFLLRHRKPYEDKTCKNFKVNSKNNTCLFFLLPDYELLITFDRKKSVKAAG